VEVVAEFDSVRSYSVSCLTDLTSVHGFFLTCPIEGTNNAWDHVQTVLNFLDAGVLRRGDVLVLDNCRIHKAEDTIRLLGLLLDAVGVRMFFLPRYCPEVMPFCCCACVPCFDACTVQPMRASVWPC